MRYIVIGFMTHSTQLRGPNMPQGAWRSAAAIGVSLAAMLAATGDLFLLAALPFLVALDWSTRQRQRPVLDLLGRRECAQEIAEVVGERMKLEPNGFPSCETCYSKNPRGSLMDAANV